MHAPETRYAKSGDLRIAYQVVGGGPIDVVLAPGTVGVTELYWEEPAFAGFLAELASFSRLMIFDVRGTGLSDRPAAVATLEERVDDIRAVMDAVGSHRAVLIGLSEGATMSVLHAAAHPDRTAGLVLCGGVAKSVRSPDYPWGEIPDQIERELETTADRWGSPQEYRAFANALGPSRAGDERFVEWVGRLVRFTAPPGWGAQLERMLTGIDIRSILPSIHVPTLVLHSRGDRVAEVGQGRYLAKHIPGARMVELPGADHLFWFNPTDCATGVREVRRFLRELQGPADLDRVLATVVFTDIVDSTRRAAELGDRGWGMLLDRHVTLTRASLVRFQGKEIKLTGDGMLATFDGPTRAVRFAEALRADSQRLGVHVRAGLHTGECSFKEGDVQGIAVHLAARIAEKARGGEVLVSSTVRDLSVGSDLRFRDRGVRSFKGIPDRWHLYSLEMGLEDPSIRDASVPPVLDGVESRSTPNVTRPKNIPPRRKSREQRNPS